MTNKSYIVVNGLQVCDAQCVFSHDVFKCLEVAVFFARLKNNLGRGRHFWWTPDSHHKTDNFLAPQSCVFLILSKIVSFVSISFSTLEETSEMNVNTNEIFFWEHLHAIRSFISIHISSETVTSCPNMSVVSRWCINSS